MGVFSNNRPNIVPGALISSSYVSDLYDLLSGAKPEAFILSGSLSATGSLQGTASFATSASRALTANTANIASTISVQNAIGTGSYFLAMVDSQNIDSASAELVNTQDISYNGFTGVLSFFNGVGTVQATATNAISSSRAVSASFATVASTTTSASFASTASYVATASYALNAPAAITIATSSTQIYVSVSGSDSSNGLSSIQPLKTLYAAKTAATSGSIVYVMAGEYTFDNTSGALNSIIDQVNLWKNGVTYYFMPGAKIKFINHGNVGTAMALFNATSTTNETCTVLGHLEFEQTGVGPDNSVGHNNFFKVSSDSGGTFFAQVKLLVSNHTPLTDISKSNTVSTVFNVTIVADEERWRYLGGQTGAGCCHFIYGNGSDATLNFKSYVRHRDYQYGSSFAGSAIFIRNHFSNTSTIDISGETCFNSLHELLNLRDLRHKNINVNIKQIYHDYQIYGSINGTIVSTRDASSVADYVLNLNADIMDYSDNSYTSCLFYIINPNSKINYKGNIYTRSSAGGGKCIVLCTTSGIGVSYNNQINIDANIYTLGSSETTNHLFHSYGANNVINFTGTINGNFRTVAVPSNASSVTFNNARIISTVTDNALLYYGGSTGSTIKISNSYIKMANSSSAMTSGGSTIVTINNSFIANGAANHTLYNATSTGTLQLLNSSIYGTGSGIAINYTGSIIAGNTIINTVYSGSLTGSLTTLTEMIL
jgi:hypothetical protein